jgi:hypothetical protein
MLRGNLRRDLRRLAELTVDTPRREPDDRVVGGRAGCVP